MVGSETYSEMELKMTCDQLLRDFAPTHGA